MKANQAMVVAAMAAVGLMCASSGAMACGASAPGANGAVPKCFSWSDHQDRRGDVERMAESGPWRVVELPGYPLGRGDSARAQFRVDAGTGRFGGRGFCNSYFGSISGWGAGRVKLGDMGQSKMFCMGESMRGDEALFSALEEGGKVVWEGGGFSLIDGSGVMRVRMVKSDRP